VPYSTPVRTKKEPAFRRPFETFAEFILSYVEGLTPQGDTSRCDTYSGATAPALASFSSIARLKRPMSSAPRVLTQFESCTVG